MFSQVSVHGEGARYSRQAGSTHPDGMLSCFHVLSFWRFMEFGIRKGSSFHFQWMIWQYRWSQFPCDGPPSSSPSKIQTTNTSLTSAASCTRGWDHNLQQGLHYPWWKQSNCCLATQPRVTSQWCYQQRRLRLTTSLQWNRINRYNSEVNPTSPRNSQRRESFINRVSPVSTRYGLYWVAISSFFPLNSRKWLSYRPQTKFGAR